MPISFVAVPPRDLDVVVHHAASVPGVSAVVLGHELFQLGLEELAAGASLEAANPVALRFVVESGDKGIAIIEASLPKRKAATSIIGRLGSGPANALYESARTVDESAFSDRTYELRVLHVPAVYVTCLWFHADDADVLLPYGALPSSLTARHYSPASLFRSLKAIARRRVAAEAKLKEVRGETKKSSASDRRSAPRNQRGTRPKRSARARADARVLQKRPRRGK